MTLMYEYIVPSLKVARSAQIRIMIIDKSQNVCQFKLFHPYLADMSDYKTLSLSTSQSRYGLVYICMNIGWSYYGQICTVSAIFQADMKMFPLICTTSN